MSANASTTASLSPVTSGRRSLFSKLTSPLRSRTRNLTDFHIRPADPHRQYSPGDLVKGAVVLTVVKPIRITHLTVCLHGFVRVFKHTGGANEAIPVDAGLSACSNPRKTQYFGNGHASLFQDEITLCGEGRLDAGVYEFNFELEFPRRGLPTSIDFERGTISYMISSTITRPTSIAATSTCDQKVSLVETVDIGPMHPPKPRTISLEPISRRTRRVRTLRNKDNAAQQDGKEAKGAGATGETSGETAHQPDESASECSSMDHGNPRSPVSVDFQSSVSATNSADSTTSSTSFRVAVASARSTKDSQQSSEKAAPVSDKTITATVELLKAGCLPGENLPLKISIKHTKAIKSMHGIIVTLYRQGRIDSAPPLSLFVDINGKEAERLKHEEYYPKSKTGLGGLSLTSAGSSSLFRKDLAQTFAPILIDPTTLSAVVNVSVRVPEDAFPTICGVPGEMISFKYHVEVVMDLGGKLAGSERHIPRVGTLSQQHSNPNAAGQVNGNPNLLSAWEGSIVDTDHIRREKSVVACLFEIIVGTTDSARNRGRGNSLMTKKASETYEAPPPPPPTIPTHEPIYEEEAAYMGNGLDQTGEQTYPYPYYDEQYQEYYDDGYGYQHYPEHPPPAHANIHVPPPEIQAEEHLTEKDRVRRAEERLLPSRPPQDAGASSSNVLTTPSLATATAPSVIASVPEEDLYTDDATPFPTAPPLQPVPGSSRQPATNTYLPSAPPTSEMILRRQYLTKLPDLPPTPPPKDTPMEDKQELERRRMLAEASAPSDIPEDDNAGEGSSSVPYLATAPVIPEEEYGDSFAHHEMSASEVERGRGRGGGLGGAGSGSAGPAGGGAERHDESLPRYER